MKPDDPVPKRSADYHLTEEFQKKKKTKNLTTALLLTHVFVTIPWNWKTNTLEYIREINVWVANGITEKGKMVDMKNCKV